MRSLFAKQPPVSFFVMAFLFSWVAVIPLLLTKALPVEPFQILGGFAGPAFAAVLAIVAIEGRQGLQAFFKHYLQCRAGIMSWLLVLFGILIALNIVAALFLGPSIGVGFFNLIGLVLPPYLITLVAGAGLYRATLLDSGLRTSLSHLDRLYGGRAADINPQGQLVGANLMSSHGAQAVL